MDDEPDAREFAREVLIDEGAAVTVATSADEALATAETNAKFAYRPSLLIVDGGLPQVNAAARAVKDSGVEGLHVVGLAKRLEEVWVPGDEFPIILPRATDELFLLQRIRDEAHRFAITAQRASRSKTISSQLLEIDGLGERRARLLLRKFGSIKRISAASAEEIAQLPGFGPKNAEIVLSALTES